MNQTHASEYETDIVLWSERQADLLRRRASGELVNDAAVDWPNLAEEIEDLGRNQLHAVGSLLTQALLHMLKAAAWPASEHVAHWQADARLFRRQARRRWTPSMMQRVDLAELYADARYAMPETMGGQPPMPVAAACPVTVNELLAD